MAQLKVTKGQAVGGTLVSGAVMAILLAIGTNEGGYVWHKSDPGGETNHGVTKRVAVERGYAGPMKSLPKETAQKITYEAYIKEAGYDPIVTDSPALGYEISDSGYNAGTGRSSRWFQQSLNLFNRQGKDYPNISVDGQVGRGTMGAWDSLKRVRGRTRACELMVKAMDGFQFGHYANLAGNGLRDTKFEDFMVGWVDTRIGNVVLSDCRLTGVDLEG